MPQVEPEKADIVWIVYELVHNTAQNQYFLTRKHLVYTLFESALQKITLPEAGKLEDFMENLQEKLDGKMENSVSPDAPTLIDIINQ